jgi:hypothetical protein
MLSQLIKQFPNHRVVPQKKHIRGKYTCGVAIRHPDLYDLVGMLRGWYPINRWVDLCHCAADGAVYSQFFQQLKNTPNCLVTCADFNKISVYFVTADELIEFVNWMQGHVLGVSDSRFRIECILAVPDNLATDAWVVGKKYADYDFKVITRPFENHNYAQLQKTFAAIADQVHLPKNFQDQILGTAHYSSSYFYVKNQSTLTYLYLNCAPIIRRVYTIHKPSCTNL